MSTRFFGLTGGIGSGKSTVLKIFADHGVPTLDLDQVGKDMLYKPSVLKSLVEAFGTEILNRDQSINHKKLAQIAFANSGNTVILNTIMHPAIQEYERTWRKKQTAPIAVIEASVLIESAAYKRMDGVIVVMAELNTRRQRTLRRGNHTTQSLEPIIQRQCSDRDRLRHADYILHNDADLAALTTAVETLLIQLAP